MFRLLELLLQSEKCGHGFLGLLLDLFITKATALTDQQESVVMVCFGCCWSFNYSSTYSYLPSWNCGGGLLSLLLGFCLNSSTYLPSRKFGGSLL
jgi:hypothetical protein